MANRVKGLAGCRKLVVSGKRVFVAMID